MQKSALYEISGSQSRRMLMVALEGLWKRKLTSSSQHDKRLICFQLTLENHLSSPQMGQSLTLLVWTFLQSLGQIVRLESLQSK